MYANAVENHWQGGVLTLPWEDEDNEYAYVTCPHCGAENIQYGFDEEDD